ncbi:phosphoenolpyruvate-utilizing N-terminal domain-containing protein, partial [Amycolatopsis sp. NPDC004378]
MQLSGVGVSPGRVAGPRVVVAADLPEPASTPISGELGAEAGRIGPSAAAVAARLSDRARSVSGDARSVLETTAAMASDPALLASAETLVRERSLPAPRAVWEAAGEFMTALQAAGGYMAERARDVADVRDRIVADQLGVTPPGVPDLTEPSVLVARDLAPA